VESYEEGLEGKMRPGAGCSKIGTVPFNPDGGKQEGVLEGEIFRTSSFFLSEVQAEAGMGDITGFLTL
jgi:hypothetical protein